MESETTQCDHLKWTTLPDPWIFILLRRNKDLSIILNNMTYFTIYTAFLVWFAKVFIERAQVSSGKNLQAKDKYFLVVTSMVSAMHLLWPFLLFLTHYLTCSFYPWTTAVVVLFLHFCFLEAPLRELYSFISSTPSLFIYRITKNFTFKWLTRVRDIYRATEEVTAPVFIQERKILSPEGFDTRPNATVIQPAVTADEEYRPSEAPMIQPRERSTELHKATEAQIIESRFGNLSSDKDPENLRIQPQNLAEKEYKTSEAPRVQSRTSGFDTKREETKYYPEFSGNSGVDALVGKTGYLRGYGKSVSFRRAAYLKNKKETEISMFKSQSDRSIEYKDFSQQVDFIAGQINTAFPRINRVKKPKEFRLHSDGGYQGLYGNHEIGYCGRCWKLNNLPFRPGFSSLRKPRTTRLGKAYGPPSYFMSIHRYITDYGKRIPKWINSNFKFS